MVNKPLIRPYFLERVAFGGVARIPTIFTWFCTSQVVGNGISEPSTVLLVEVALGWHSPVQYPNKHTAVGVYDFIYDQENHSNHMKPPTKTRK